MKKQGIYLLVLLTGIFAAFVTGLFVGRNLNHQSLSADLLQVQTTLPPETTAPGADTPSDSTTPAESTDAASETTAPPAVSDGKVNINTATLEQLKTLPGIGEVLGQRILDYRAANGPFSSVSELLNVSGIGEKKLEGLLDYVTIGG